MFDLNYFKYLLKKNKHTFIYVGIVIVAIFLFPLFGNTVIDGEVSADKISYIGQYISLAVIVLILTFILPFVNFSNKFNKRAIDLYDALPLRKNKVLITTLLFQIFELLVPYAISLTIGIIMTKGTCAEINLVLGYGALTIVIVSIINTAIIFKTNSIFDGVVMLGAYHALPFMLYASIYIVLSSIISTISYFPYIDKCLYLSPFILYARLADFEKSSVIIPLILLILYFVISLVSLYRDFQNRKPEKVEGISDDFFAYRFIINAYLFLVAVMIAAANESADASITLIITLFAVLIAVFMLADFIYTRKIKINFRKIVKAIIVIIISLGIVKFVSINKGFGLDRIYPNNYEFIRFGCYSNVVLKDNEGNLFEGGVEFYSDYIPKTNEAAVSIIQQKQDELAIKSYGATVDVYTSPRFYINYMGNKYNIYNESMYSYSIANFDYKTEFEDIIDFLTDPAINSTFIANIYTDAEYNEVGEISYDSYDEFIKDYQIVTFGSLGYYFEK